MAADATAAAYLQGAQKNFDPMGAYAAGVMLRSNLQKVDLAAQAQTSSSILQLLQVQNEQADQRRRDELAKQQLAIASYNAETQRIRALQPRKTSSSGVGGGTGGASGFKYVDGQLVLDTSALNGAPAGGGAVAQGPTEGEGDGTEVLPLQNGPESPSLMGVGGSLNQTAEGMSPLPDMDPRARREPEPSPAPSGGTHIPGLANGQALMFGQQQQQQPAPFAAGGQIMPNVGAQRQSAGSLPPGMIPVTGFSFNSKGQLSLRGNTPDPKDAAAPQLTQAMLESINRSVAHLGKRAVPTKGSTKEGITEFDFEDIPSLKGSDFSLSSLAADKQKELMTDAMEIGAMAMSVNSDPSIAEKIRAAGITLPDNPSEDDLKKAGGEMVAQKKDWDAAYVAAKQQKQNQLLERAAKHAIAVNSAFARKDGYVPIGAMQVLQGLGLSPDMVQSGQPQQQGGPRSSVAMAGAGQDSLATTGGAAAAPAAATTPAKPAAQPQAGAQPAAKPGRDATGHLIDPADTAAPSSYQVKKQTANEQWESTKKALNDEMTDTTTMREHLLLRDGARSGGDPSLGIPASGETAEELQQKWVEKNADKLAAKGIKPKDGGKLTLESVVFVDNLGRSIKLKEVIREMFKDERYGQFDKAADKTKAAETAKANLQPETKSFLQKILGQ